MSALDPSPVASLDSPDTTPLSNPYEAVHTTYSNPKSLQEHYTTHRTTRNAQSRALLLSPLFPGPSIDAHLARLIDPSSTYTDPRHCLVFWARPPAHIRALISTLQAALLTTHPHIWLMPSAHLHMTALELAHSRSAAEIAILLARLGGAVPAVANYTGAHRARLVRPLLSYDAAAVALSFVPAAAASGDEYSYHHLRRDLWDACSAAGVRGVERYVAPSAHVTVARFVSAEDFEGGAAGLVREIERLNAWLSEEWWGAAGEWVVGQEKGLDCRAGALWYGGGETVFLGEGF